MKNITVNISIPDTLLEAADKQASRELRNRSELFRESLRLYLNEKGSVSFMETYTSNEIQRVQDVVNFADYSDSRILVLSCVYRPQPNNVSNLFSGSTADVVKLVENPPHFRHAGWDLQTLDRAKPVAGDYLQVSNGERKVLRVFRDGQVTFAGDEKFIGWGVNKEEGEPFAVNGLAVTELVTNFVNFCYLLSANLERPPLSMIIKLRFLNPAKEDIRLINVVKGSGGFNEVAGSLHLDLAERDVLINLEEEFSLTKSTYRVLSELFYFFGVSEDRFWYVNKESKEVNLEFFKEK